MKYLPSPCKLEHWTHTILHNEKKKRYKKPIQNFSKKVKSSANQNVINNNSGFDFQHTSISE